jgi:hypothetical protein
MPLLTRIATSKMHRVKPCVVLLVAWSALAGATSVPWLVPASTVATKAKTP